MSCLSSIASADGDNAGGKEIRWAPDPCDPPPHTHLCPLTWGVLVMFQDSMSSADSEVSREHVPSPPADSSVSPRPPDIKQGKNNTPKRRLLENPAFITGTGQGETKRDGDKLS